jgi:hypothetical protein
MAVDWESRKECCATFWTKFFSLIIGICMGVSGFLFAIGIFRYLNAVKRFSRDEIAHFITLGLAGISTTMFIATHAVPKRVTSEILTILAVLLVLSEGMVSHSMGLAAPTVDDCNGNGRVDFLNGTITNVNGIANTGTLGQSLGDCLDMQLIFAGSFLLLIFQTIGVFDIQRLILQRTRSKTYADRFVEMGIREGPPVEG